MQQGSHDSARPESVSPNDEDIRENAQSAVGSDVERDQENLCLVLFVCTGNTCRSPLAEALFKKQLADRLNGGVEDLEKRGFRVLSAGLAAMMGGPAAQEAIAAASAFGADLTAHRSRPLTPELAIQADFLVTMTQSHAQAVVDYFPRLANPPRLLDPAGNDLDDPIGQPREVYETCARQIWDHLQALLAEVVESGPAKRGSEERKQS